MGTFKAKGILIFAEYDSIGISVT